jgi:hypothetical protein
VRIVPGEDEVAVRFHGSEQSLYVSNNPSVQHRDSRCVFDHDVCSFALVRAFFAYRVTCTSGHSEVKEAAQDEMVRFSKGEVVDVSMPHFEDVNLQLWLAQERAEPGSFAVPADIVAGGTRLAIRVESLDAQILEQRDLTFGKRMQSILIWRIAKVHKRLTRLMELVGVKALTVAGFTWAQKARSFGELGRMLAEFRSATLPASLQRAGSEFFADFVPGTRKRRQTVGGVQSAAAGQRRVASVKKRFMDPFQIAEVLDLSMAKATVLDPLESLATKVFSQERQKDLPPNFLERWNGILEHLTATVAMWQEAFEQLDFECSHGEGPASIEEAQLYQIDLGHSWDFAT